jgi:hypothetical protein
MLWKSQSERELYMDTDLKMSLLTTVGALAMIIAFSFIAALN